MRKLLILCLLAALVIVPTSSLIAQDMAFDCGTDEEVTLTFFGDPVGSHPVGEENTIARFNELCPNITVERYEGAASVTDLLGFYLQAFEAQSSDLDVIRVDVIWPGQLAEHLIDLSEYVPQEHIDAQLPALIENDTIDGRLVALPLRIGFGMLYYRPDLLEKYGFDAPPTTWDELEEMAKTIQEGERAEGNADFWGFVWQGNAYEGLTCNALEWHVSATGSNFLQSDGTISALSDEVVAMYEQAASWVGTISPPGVVSYVEDDARGVWHAGNAAFMRNWPYAYVLSGESEDIPEFAVAPLPAGAAGMGASTLGGWHIGVSRYSDQPEAAAAFARYMTSVENQKEYALDTSSPPAALELYDDPDIQAALPFASTDIVEITTARPSNFSKDQYNAVSTLYFTAIHSILTGEEDAEVALELLELDLEALVGE
jgi:trehalose/maltose transport system substrate-binding protein